MRDIVRDLRLKLREDFSPGLWLVLVLLLAAAFGYNYATDFKLRVMNGLSGRWPEIPAYLLFYGLPYFGTAALVCAWRGETSRLRARGFWIAGWFVLLCLAANRPLLLAPGLLTQGLDLPAEFLWFLRRCLGNLLRLAGLGLPVLLLWLALDRGDRRLYGLAQRGYGWRPFLLMLLAMAPLVLAASFDASFQRTYPLYRPGAAEAALGWPGWLRFLLHEITYVGRFVGVEWVFRGFLVLGMVRWLGRGVLLPMVVLYAFWHFGKPLGEAIGSVLGAWILGAVALRGGIRGAILVHAGIAVLMNLVAWIHLLVTS